MRFYVDRIVRRRDVEPGGAADVVVEAFEAGKVSRSECASMLIDLLNPSIDTTASIIAAALQLFADHPDQWARLRDDRSLLSNAVHEIVRMASPLRAFARRAERDAVVGGTRIGAGSRLLVLFASANRDERFWTEPDAFDITRDARSHVGFGYGAHSCAGQGLGRLETTAVLDALLDRVTFIERRGEGERAVNNVIHRWHKLPLRLHS
ncbi:cytochrome P450 [Rhodococcoides corynebacterioides]|uniref:cytochrome P450 n=1 Tax=Rhodococcoides corynebacterioides TaxID=53972 RepID=UPI0021C14498|nr:cytochrome P450 [Rhodococcus corynebacterioides]